jgi:ornithine cyclodeaminase/alanine dehydrogenase-like protein (mu-crystallin family)
VDATFADILAGRHFGRTSADQLLLSTPFGMAILEIALAAEVLPASGSWAWNAPWRIMPPL